jgi:hypothetical protein
VTVSAHHTATGFPGWGGIGRVKGKVRVKFAVEHAVKALRWRRGIALLCL